RVEGADCAEDGPRRAHQARAHGAGVRRLRAHPGGKGRAHDAHHPGAPADVHVRAGGRGPERNQEEEVTRAIPPGVSPPHTFLPVIIELFPARGLLPPAAWTSLPGSSWAWSPGCWHPSWSAAPGTGSSAM